MVRFPFLIRSRNGLGTANKDTEAISAPTFYEPIPQKWMLARDLFARSDVRVGYSEQLARPIRVRGNVLTDYDYLRLGFGCRGGEIFVKRGNFTISGENKPTITIEGSNPSIYQSPSRIHILRSSGAVIIYCQEFALQPGCRRQGYSRFALALQLRAAALAGIRTIVANAHGHQGIDFQGYAAWPELGFDGLIPQPIWDGLPKRGLVECGFDPEKPTMIRELLAAGAGARHLWTEHGAGFLLSLSTDPGSPVAAGMLNLLRRAKL